MWQALKEKGHGTGKFGAESADTTRMSFYSFTHVFILLLIHSFLHSLSENLLSAS